MYAEITIKTKENLPADLSQRLSMDFTEVDIRGALGFTVWEKDPDAIFSTIIFAQQSNPKTILVYQPEDPKTFKIHIENFVKNHDLLKLKKSVKETIEIYEDFVERQIISLFGKNSIKKLEIIINAEGDDIMVGERLSWWSRFWISFKGDLFAKTYIPVITFFVLKLGFAEEINQAFSKAIVATICAIIWIVFSATCIIKPLAYDEK